MAETVTIHDAKTHLSRLLAAVEAGKEIVIARGKTPIAKIVPLSGTPRKRKGGAWKELVQEQPGAWDPWTDEELGNWYDKPL
jgi:prevent-host-death family protein